MVVVAVERLAETRRGYWWRSESNCARRLVRHWGRINQIARAPPRGRVARSSRCTRKRCLHRRKRQRRHELRLSSAADSVSSLRHSHSF